MYKKCAIVLAGLILTGCQNNMNDQKEWVNGDGCERYFSETARDLAACKAYVASQNSGTTTNDMAALSVKTTPEGATVSVDEGIKRFEHGEDNIDD